MPSLIELARPLGRGEATVLTLKSGVPGAQTTSDGAKKLDWGFGTRNEPPVTGEVTNGGLERSVRLRLPDRSFKATVQAQTPDGLRTFTRTFTTPSLPDTGDAGKVVDALKSLKTPPVFAVGATDTLTAQSKSCSPTKIWSGEQKMSGCFKPIEQLGDIPNPEKGAVHELGNQLKLDETKTALMGKATQLTDGYVANGKALLNDKFPVTPSQAASIVSIPQAKSLISAKAELPVGGATYDPKNGFNLKLDPKKVKIPLGKLPKPPKLPSLAGLEIVGDWDVDLDKQEAKIKASVKLPPAIKKAGVQISNEVQLRATPERVIVDSVRVGPIDVDIASLKVNKFQIQYRREPDQWDGQGKACVIGTACLDMIPPQGGVTIKNGDLAQAGATLGFPPPGLPLFTGVNLERIGFGIGLHPTRIAGSARVGVGQLLKLDGRIFVAFPDSQEPFVFDRKDVGDGYPAQFYGRKSTTPTFGATAAAFLQVPVVGETRLAGAYALYEYPSYAAFGGDYRADILELISIKGGVDAEADFDQGLFNVHGEVSTCLHIVEDLCKGAVANVSRGRGGTGGAGACIQYGPVSIGGGVQWQRVSEPFIWPFDGCKWSRFTAVVRSSAVRAAAAPGTYTMKVEKGKPSPALQLDGVDGAPTIRVRGPGGQLFEAPAGKGWVHSPDARIRIMRFDKKLAHFTVVGLQNAEPGTYTVETLPGSPQVAGVKQATDQPDAKVTGTVTGKGRRRVLRYDVRAREGQKVVFEELQPSGAARRIGTATGGRGRIGFSSAPGSGRRRVVAQFELSGIPAERKLVTTFKPQSIHLAAPKGVRVRHRGNRLLVSWRRVPGAARYEVAASLSGRRMAFATTRGRKVTVRGVWPWLGGRVRVRALDSMRQSTPARGRRFRATGLRPSPFRTLFTCRVGARKIACGPPRSSCLAQRLVVAGRRIGPARLGANGLALLRRYPPVSLRARPPALCVRGGGQVWVGSTNGPIDLIATTASGHRTRQAGPGRLRRAEITGARRLAPGLLVGHRVGNGRVIYGVRGRGVRFLAVVTLRQLKHPRAVSRRLRSLGLG